MRQFIIRQAENGLHVLLLAFFVYLLTVAPDVTLWDCGEFVCCGAQLDVSHPPGAPLAWLVMRLFVILFPHGCEALACNVSSALAMSFAAMELSLVCRLLLRWATPRVGRWSLLVAQSVAGLVFAFCISVWSVATEAEVYSLAVLLALLPLHIALVWRQAPVGSACRARCVALCAFVGGLAAGVHWLSWLTLPAVGAVFGSHGGWRRMSLGALCGLLAAAVLVFLASGGGLHFALLADVFFVNVLGLPVGSGLAVVGLGLLVIFFVVRRLRPVALPLSCGFVVLFLPLLRAHQGVQVAVGAPSDVRALADYLGREQYGHRALLWGPSFVSRPSDVRYDDVLSYSPQQQRYVARHLPADYVYPDSDMFLFPRMYADDDLSISSYSSWASNPSLQAGAAPSLADNVVFCFRYQLGHMFLRYFLWNFCGRQNSRQGFGGYADGNFIVGIPFLDHSRLCLPAYEPVANGRVAYFALPLVACLVGLVLLGRCCSLRPFAVVGVMALVSGPALAVYLNMPPFEPRERDYVFLLFFAAMSIPVGVSVALFSRWLSRRGLRIVAGVLAVGLPLLMVVSGWGCSSRRADTLVRDAAVSILRLCPEDAILFVGGDNETYPLWYAQEVLGVRTDVRVVNHSLLSASWYARQVLAASRGASPLQARSLADVADGCLPTLIVSHDSVSSRPVALARIEPSVRSQAEAYFFAPSDSLSVMVADTMVSLAVSANAINTSDLLLLQVIDQNPHRPVCLMPQVTDLQRLGLSPYVWDFGMLRFIVPDTAAVSPFRREQMFSNSLSLPDALSYNMTDDEQNHLVSLNVRATACLLASSHLQSQDFAAASRTLRLCLSWFPASCVPQDPQLLSVALLLQQAGDVVLARHVLASIANAYALQLKMAASINAKNHRHAVAFVDNNLLGLNDLLQALDDTDNPDIAASLRNLAQGLGFE